MFDFFYNFAGLNTKIFLFINHATNVSILPQILQLVSWPFGISKFALYYVILAICFGLQLMKIPSHLRENEFWHVYNKMTLAGLTYACFGFIYAALKFSINLPRPFCSLPVDSFKTVINTETERCLSSFPSAHTGLAVLIAYLLWPYLRNSGKVAAVIIILLVGISRMTLAMHYPADILYSFFVAFIVIIIGKVVYKVFENNIIRSVGKIILKFVAD